jgi:regulator of ribonuclease activity B
MAKLEKTSGYKDGKALAREMARSLKGTPYDASKPIPFSFYLYVPNRQKATRCAKVLKADAHETEVDKSAASDGKWLCLCHATLTLSDGTVSKLGNRLVQLAKEHGGEFDGWEVNPYQSPGALTDLMALITDLKKKMK